MGLVAEATGDGTHGPRPSPSPGAAAAAPTHGAANVAADGFQGLGLDFDNVILSFLFDKHYLIIK